MNKTELVEQVKNRAHAAGWANASAAQCDRIIHALCEVIKDNVASGEDVRLPGFGSFRAKRQVERPGRNPQTGEVVTIPARNKVVFKPFSDFTGRVNS